MLYHVFFITFFVIILGQNLALALMSLEYEQDFLRVWYDEAFPLGRGLVLSSLPILFALLDDCCHGVPLGLQDLHSWFNIRLLGIGVQHHSFFHFTFINFTDFHQANFLNYLVSFLYLWVYRWLRRLLVSLFAPGALRSSSKRVPLFDKVHMISLILLESVNRELLIKHSLQISSFLHQFGLLFLLFQHFRANFCHHFIDISLSISPQGTAPFLFDKLFLFFEFLNFLL